MKRIVTMSFALLTFGATPSFGQVSAPSPSCHEVSANVAKYIGKTVTFVGVLMQNKIETNLDGKPQTSEIYACSDAKGQIEDVVNAFGGFSLDPDASTVDAAAVNSQTRRVTGVVTAVKNVTPRIAGTPTKKTIPWLTKVQISMP